MSFTGNEDHTFPLSTASQWTENYRNSISAGETIAHYFGKAAIQAILDQDYCVGIQIYYALDDAGQKHLIVVGANELENDLYEGKIAERSRPCPSACSTANPLNS